MKKENLSKQAQSILEDKYGYRCEDVYQEGVQDLKEIINYEVVELNNVDIIETCMELYPELENFLTEEKLEEINEGELEEKELEEISAKLYMYLKEKSGQEKPKAIWVCSEKEEANLYYGDNPEEEFLEEEDCDENIITVKFSGELFVVSDLSEEGVLIMGEFEKE